MCQKKIVISALTWLKSLSKSLPQYKKQLFTTVVFCFSASLQPILFKMDLEHLGCNCKCHQLHQQHDAAFHLLYGFILMTS